MLNIDGNRFPFFTVSKKKGGGREKKKFMYSASVQFLLCCLFIGMCIYAH